MITEYGAVYIYDTKTKKIIKAVKGVNAINTYWQSTGCFYYYEEARGGGGVFRSVSAGSLIE